MKRFCAGLLAFCLFTMCGCSSKEQEPIMYIVDRAYNLTPQEYIDLMNQAMESQEDGDYLTLPNWNEATAKSIWITLSFRIAFDVDDNGKITCISYHWKNTSEASNTAAFLVGATINMLTVSESQGDEIVEQLDMFDFQKKHMKNLAM